MDVLEGALSQQGLRQFPCKGPPEPHGGAGVDDQGEAEQAFR